MASLLSSLAGNTLSFIKTAINVNASFLTGALDVIAVKHDDGTILCTKFHVRFGRFSLWALAKKPLHVRIFVNGEATDLVMKLDDYGEAFFLHPTLRNRVATSSAAPVAEQAPPQSSAGAASAAEQAEYAALPMAHDAAGAPAAIASAHTRGAALGAGETAAAPLLPPPSGAVGAAAQSAAAAADSSASLSSSGAEAAAPSVRTKLPIERRFHARGRFSRAAGAPSVQRSPAALAAAVGVSGPPRLSSSSKSKFSATGLRFRHLKHRIAVAAAAAAAAAGEEKDDALAPSGDSSCDAAGAMHAAVQLQTVRSRSALLRPRGSACSDTESELGMNAVARALRKIEAIMKIREREAPGAAAVVDQGAPSSSLLSVLRGRAGGHSSLASTVAQLAPVESASPSIAIAIAVDASTLSVPPSSPSRSVVASPILPSMENATGSLAPAFSGSVGLVDAGRGGRDASTDSASSASAASPGRPRPSLTALRRPWPLQRLQHLLGREANRSSFSCLVAAESEAADSDGGGGGGIDDDGGGEKEDDTGAVDDVSPWDSSRMPRRFLSSPSVFLATAARLPPGGGAGNGVGGAFGGTGQSRDDGGDATALASPPASHAPSLLLGAAPSHLPPPGLPPLPIFGDAPTAVLVSPAVVGDAKEKDATPVSVVVPLPPPAESLFSFGKITRFFGFGWNKSSSSSSSVGAASAEGLSNRLPIGGAASVCSAASVTSSRGSSRRGRRTFNDDGDDASDDSDLYADSSSSSSDDGDEGRSRDDERSSVRSPPPPLSALGDSRDDGGSISLAEDGSVKSAGLGSLKDFNAAGPLSASSATSTVSSRAARHAPSSSSFGSPVGASISSRTLAAAESASTPFTMKGALARPNPPTRQSLPLSPPPKPLGALPPASTVEIATPTSFPSFLRFVTLTAPSDSPSPSADPLQLVPLMKQRKSPFLATSGIGFLLASPAVSSPSSTAAPGAASASSVGFGGTFAGVAAAGARRGPDVNDGTAAYRSRSSRSCPPSASFALQQLFARSRDSPLSPSASSSEPRQDGPLSAPISRLSVRSPIIEAVSRVLSNALPGMFPRRRSALLSRRAPLASEQRHCSDGSVDMLGSSVGAGGTGGASLDAPTSSTGQHGRSALALVLSHRRRSASVDDPRLLIRGNESPRARALLPVLHAFWGGASPPPPSLFQRLNVARRHDVAAKTEIHSDSGSSGACSTVGLVVSAGIHGDVRSSSCADSVRTTTSAAPHSDNSALPNAHPPSASSPSRASVAATMPAASTAVVALLPAVAPLPPTATPTSRITSFFSFIWGGKASVPPEPPAAGASVGSLAPPSSASGHSSIGRSSPLPPPMDATTASISSDAADGGSGASTASAAEDGNEKSPQRAGDEGASAADDDNDSFDAGNGGGGKGNVLKFSFRQQPQLPWSPRNQRGTVSPAVISGANASGGYDTDSSANSRLRWQQRGNATSTGAVASSSSSSKRVRYTKSFVPTNEQLVSLPLRMGANVLRFEVFAAADPAEGEGVVAASTFGAGTAASTAEGGGASAPTGACAPSAFSAAEAAAAGGPPATSAPAPPTAVSSSSSAPTTPSPSAPSAAAVTSVTCLLYLWNPDVKIVISDVDGTITKSDVMGHVSYAMGFDWTHAGIAELYSAIRDNNYQVMYLTSRAIGQKASTMELLEGVAQAPQDQQEGGARVAAAPRASASSTAAVPAATPQPQPSPRRAGNASPIISYSSASPAVPANAHTVGGSSLGGSRSQPVSAPSSAVLTSMPPPPSAAPPPYFSLRGGAAPATAMAAPPAPLQSAEAPSTKARLRAGSGEGAWSLQVQQTNQTASSPSSSSSAAAAVGAGIAMPQAFGSSIAPPTPRSHHLSLSAALLPPPLALPRASLAPSFSPPPSSASPTPSNHGSAPVPEAGGGGGSSSSGGGGGKFRLPRGPVITSPDRLVAAFTREVIRRKPEEFKIAALKAIKALFPADKDPFFAGFGNRITDVISYRAVGVADSRIFVVDPKGDIRLHDCTAGVYKKSYPQLARLADAMFPPVTELPLTAPCVGARYGKPLSTHSAFGDAQFWRTPLATLTAEDCAAAVAPPTRSNFPPPKVPAKGAAKSAPPAKPTAVVVGVAASTTAAALAAAAAAASATADAAASARGGGGSSSGGGGGDAFAAGSTAGLGGMMGFGLSILGGRKF